MEWHYEKLDEDGKLKKIYSFQNDVDGKITGHCVMNVKAWFDENPAERIRLGWTKHITYEAKEVEELYPHNKQTQYLIISQRLVDEWTVEDVYHVMEKSEEMMLFEEMLAVSEGFGSVYEPIRFTI